MKKVLLLNADYSAEKFLTWQNALLQNVLASKNAIYTVSYFENWIVKDTVGRKYKVPAVMALKKYVNLGVRTSPYTKKNIYIRDLMICQYCHQKFKSFDLTIDHVIPVSVWRNKNLEGSCSSFENVVTACKRCNSVKGNKTPEEAGLTLLRKPRVLTRRECFRNQIRLMPNVPDEWKPYVADLTSEIN